MRGHVEAVGVQRFGNGAFHLLQARDNPLVDKAVGQRGAFVLAAIVAVYIHQHKAAGVPQFIAEVAVALGAFEVEIDAAPQAGVAGHGEAQGVGTEHGNARRKQFFGVFLYLRGAFGAAEAGGAFNQQVFQINAVNQELMVLDCLTKLITQVFEV